MNYLAHVYLADRVGSSLTGNLMGDFVRGRLHGEFPPAIERGLQLHRKVDMFTDSHPVPRTSRRRFAPPFRRYAGILVDLFYDHCLARDWADYHSEPLDEFTARVYACLARDEAWLVEPLRSTHERMRRHDVLASYTRLDSLERALHQLSHRSGKANPLAEGLLPLRTHYDALYADFRAFMPALLTFTASQWRNFENPV